VTTCKQCDRELAAEELVGHERGRYGIVYCPDCEFVLGRYDRHGDESKTDRLRT
jgi:hypothetical protein